MRILHRAAVALVAALVAAGAAAHDTWFQPLPATPGGHAVFLLGTGTRFPSYEFPLGYEYLVASGCRGEGANAAPLAHVEDRPAGLVVRSAAPLDTQAGFSCWAQLKAFDVEVPPDKIEVYLREIQASPALRATWAAMKARGLPWRENYTKSARIEVGGNGPRTAAPLAMDVLLDNPRLPIRAGDELTFQVLRDGAPLPGLPVELVGNLSPPGILRRTDAQGRISVTVPLAGRWILRGVDLHVSSKTADEWESWFVTLAFEVAPAAR
jgi:Domain of unknown function (DUF4198)